jgi:probable rRNA maturation factor
MNGKRARSITLRNAQRKLRVDVPALQMFAEAALEEACRTTAEQAPNLSAVQQVDVALVSDTRMAALHQRFMGIAGPTDVMTFQHGEIVVSVETAADQAREHDASLDAELRLYIVHGILHLLGFDDTTPAAAQVMERTQTRIVASVSDRS